MNVKDDFAHRAADWDAPAKIKMTEIFVAEVFKHISPEETWKGLEIGAGTGLVGLQILPFIDSIVFEDTSEAMLEVLKSKIKDDEKAEIVHGEIFEFQNKDIDFAFSCMAFHHIPEIEKALAHLHNILKPGAFIAIGDLMPENGSFHSFEPIPHKGFDTDLLSRKFEEAGFEVHVCKKYDTLVRERTPGVFSNYDQFILIAKNNGSL